MLGLYGVASLLSRERLPVVSRAEDQDAGTAGGDVAELAQEALAAHERGDALPQEGESISVDIPPQPLPGQRRPDSSGQCQLRGELKIQGGCWFRVPDAKAPCKQGEYEWMGGCYHPSYPAPRQPTTNQPEPGRDAQ
jgi:hypothetical protein